MKASELVKALEEGKLLGYTNDFGEVTYMFILLFEYNTILEVRGWQSSKANHDRYLRLLLLEPENWHIVKPTKEHVWYDEQYQIATFRKKKIAEIAEEL